ncbi:MAG: 3-methyl-2-oxobutanoate hydroxymethyltransferase [Spongiibacteraceae bacterium]|jgi:3-methyl-2-oxobutanoate hydroxymethyltransferase|nr:3-methyl-2-oxobutanoate hydroxymethyltransferase [Spongiibacteraceae bacterium]
MASITIPDLQARRAAGERFATIALYDASFARLAAAAGIEVILVGDSLGMVVQGHTTTLPVTVADMVYHVAAVRRGAADSLIIADMPFGSYATPELALTNAALLMQAGAQMVKLEGGAWLADTVRMLVERGIPVCGHLGLTPQSVNAFGGFRVQGRSAEQAGQIVADATRLDAAGATLLVLECIPRSLTSQVMQAITIPVIGIGAGNETDSQVMVMHDLLGLSPRLPRFARNFLSTAGSVEQAFRDYRAAVLSGEFPSPEQSYE